MLPQGFFPGFTPDTLKDHRYFAVDSAATLDTKWPLLLNQRPDFIKTFLWFSDEFERRKDDPNFFGRRGLDPRLLPRIVEKAHANQRRVSAHVMNADDFHQAVIAGVDEIAHLPPTGLTPISVEDARLVARRGIVVVSTCGVVPTLPMMRILRESDLP